MCLCTLAGYAVSQYRPELINGGAYGLMIGFGLGGVIVGIDHMLKGLLPEGFLRRYLWTGPGDDRRLVESIATDLFIYADEKTRWVIRLGLFLGFGYLGMVLAMRSNKEEFFADYSLCPVQITKRPENLLIIDTSAIIDGRIADLIESKFLEGILVIPALRPQRAAARFRFSRSDQTRPWPPRA